MLLQKRVERAAKWLSGRRRRDEEEMPVEKGDTFTMILSALMIILPVALLVLLLLVGLPMLLFLL